MKIISASLLNSTTLILLILEQDAFADQSVIDVWTRTLFTMYSTSCVAVEA